MSASEIILPAIIIFIVLRTIASYRRKNLSKGFTLLWTAFWLAGLFLIFQQGLLTSIANLIGIGRGVDLAIYLSIIILFYLVFRIFSQLREIEKKITELVRREALKR
ncbi:MAG: DUF2304 domain-containing protein [bacterium]|nr:DUF2304 domain-containing protein [bacterium]